MQSTPQVLEEALCLLLKHRNALMAAAREARDRDGEPSASLAVEMAAVGRAAQTLLDVLKEVDQALFRDAAAPSMSSPSEKSSPPSSARKAELSVPDGGSAQTNRSD